MSEQYQIILFEKNLRESQNHVEKGCWASFVTHSDLRVTREYGFSNLYRLSTMEVFRKHFYRCTDTKFLVQLPAWLNMEFLKDPKLIEIGDLYLMWTLAICNQIFLLLLVTVKVKNNCFVSIYLPASRDAHVPEKSDSDKLHHDSNE